MKLSIRHRGSAGNAASQAIRGAGGTVTRLLILGALLVLAPVEEAAAGAYLDSAHGSTANGVLRQALSDKGYARANCAHCHEVHASIDGSEPAPADGPDPYAIFTRNFNTAKTTGAYAESDNFCFYCHNNLATFQAVTNDDYSETFGCSATAGPVDILAAFNETSYHNLYDLWNFTDTQDADFPWFTSVSNPCNACHNPHLARRNQANPRDVSFSAISRPSDHFNLWVQSMDSAYSTQYEPPYCSSSANREPAASANAADGRANTPDYVAFCTDCHNQTYTIDSTTLGRSLLQLDWSTTGDKHGSRSMNGSISLKLPYNQTSIQNYVLSCMDCHEPHGSENITLLRRRVNAGDLTGSITTALPNPPGTGSNNANVEMGYICMRCHDEDTGTNPPQWETVHHLVSDAPYPQGMCGSCHGSGRPPIACDKCHFHGADDSWLGGNAAGRLTF